MSNKSKSEHNSEQFIQSQGFTYFAFISYKHADAKWAIWLKRKLQSYRLPTKTQERHRDLPMRLCPVFLDKDHMTPGQLKNRERDEVQSAKFLIVICSQNACRASNNIDDEIQFFLDGGGDASRIIPFIVDDSDHPEMECFPLKLQELCSEGDNIIGANIRDSGKNNAVLKVVAYMHGIKLEELESEEKRRKKQRLLIRSFAAAVLFVAVCITGYMVWDHYVPKRSYYLDYTEVYGLPQGIGKLSEKDTRSLHAFYMIVSQYGKIQELRFQNSYGMLVDPSDNDMFERPARITYRYSQNGTLSEVTNYDINEKPLDTRVYSGDNLKTLDIKKYIDKDSSAYDSSQSLNAHTVHVMDSSENARVQKSNVTRYLIDYDENGYTAEIRYAANTSNYVGRDADGISGMRYERDELGRAVRTSYLTFIGDGKTATDSNDYEVIGTRTGLASVEYVYDQYDCVSIRYLNADGQLIPGLDNVCEFRKEYRDHNKFRECCYDALGEPAYSDNGYVSYEIKYDESGNEINTYFFGLDGESVAVKSGFSSQRKEYDKHGNMTRISFYGTNGLPAVHSSGYSSCEMSYDDKRNVTKYAFFGFDGSPVMNAEEGCSSWETEYDNDGNELRSAFYDTEGKLIINIYGYAICESKYDAQGHETEVRFYGADEEPVLNMYGYFTVRCEFDENGNMKEASFFGADEEPILQSEGYASWQSEYDERGNEIKTSFFGIDGKPVIISRGYSYSESEFDELGNVTESRFYGTDGKPILNSDGYARCVSEYDMHGNRIKTSYYDVDDELFLKSDGYAIWTSEFDEHGNEIKASFFGVDGKPVMKDYEYASRTSEYDACGRRISTAYFDPDGKPTEVDKGYAAWKSDCDERGNEIKTSFFGPDGELTLIDDGYAFIVKEYNRQNTAIKMSYFDTNGNPVACSEGYASWEYEYNEQKIPVAILKRDVNGEVIERITD